MFSTQLQSLIKAVATALLLCITAACQSETTGPGMILSFGSVIDGRSIAVKSAKLPDGQPFSNPGTVGGGGTRKWNVWRLIPTKVEGASGDYRGLPELVTFDWQEPRYPGLKAKDFPTPEAFTLAVEKSTQAYPSKPNA